MQAQALPVRLGLPQNASAIDTLAEYQAISAGILRTQETLRVHVSSLAQHRRLQLSSVGKRQPVSSLLRDLTTVNTYLPLLFEEAFFQRHPPCSSLLFPLFWGFLESSINFCVQLASPDRLPFTEVTNVIHRGFRYTVTRHASPSRNL